MKALSLAVIRQRYAGDGGAERFVGRMLEALQSRDVRITLLTRAWPSNAGVDVEVVDPFHIGRTWRDWSFARAVRRRVAAGRFDIVQSHERIAGCDIYRAGDGVHREWLRQRARVLGPWGRLRQRVSLYHCYTLHAERRLFSSPALRAVVCNSRMVKEEIQRHFGVTAEKLHVIYSGVDTHAFHPDLRRHRTELRKRYDIPIEATLFLFVGSGFERKGVAVLLETMARLPADTYLIVVGHDKRAARYRERTARLELASRIRFAGRQSDLTAFYGAADALVLPTLYDPFPNVALEAMASGLPLVTSTKCGAAELIREGHNGYVRDALDVSGLQRAMAELVDPKRRAAIAAAARRTVESFDFARMRSALFALYDACLQP